MKRKQYKVEINAPAEKTYDVMLGLSEKSTYDQWTSIFSPTSTFEGSWEKGGKLYFIGFDENGKKGGMVARVVENTPSQFVSLQHYGILDGEQEIVEGPQVDEWAGGFENYTFERNGEKTDVTVDVDVTEDHLEYFDTTYPKALEKLKEIVEAS
ncbi:SRPBCC family protein [Lunatibacter salilacus]|uniref:SRPBCC domain-containing protein n=1 Tax=Lunatibacter salilacus TaxID=2483804 RepID=UPI00131AE4CB|nr:SRPBCC domain-containing protein [Lunatibacter salilacus]